MRKIDGDITLNGKLLVPTPSGGGNVQSAVPMVYVDSQLTQQTRSCARAIIVDYRTTITDVKNYLNESSGHHCYMWGSRDSLEDITQKVKDGEYDNFEYFNNIFNSNEQSISFPSGYLIFKVAGDRYNIMIIGTGAIIGGGYLVHNGMLVLDSTNSVPDRYLIRESSEVKAFALKPGNPLPDTTSATAGQILGLDSNKNPQWQNAPAMYITSNIQNIPSEILEKLKCGDTVAKEDSSGKHSYVVTYKKDNVGICLSYFDGSGYIETVSYDYTNGVWVYNSTDVCNVGKELGKKADKDIISKIEMTYDEDSDFTTIIFPEGVIPLSIIINTHVLYFLDYALVDDSGVSVEGYGLDDYFTDEGKCGLEISGDISEQVINSLVYVYFNGESTTIFGDTYHLFYPVTSGGTKLYKHTINIVPSSGTPYTMATFSIISTNKFVVSQLNGVVNLINSGNTMVSRVSGSLVDDKTFLVASATAPSPVGHVFYIGSTGIIDNNTILDATSYKVGTDTVTEL